MNEENYITLHLSVPEFYPKQIQFMKSKARYTAYGGARGGGKSFAARWKAVLLANRYAGIQILLLRRTLPELRENHLIPLQKILKTEKRNKDERLAEYKDVTKEFMFPNGSRIKLGYCDSENDVLQYQGQAYDVIIMEEATHFTEFQFQTLTESNRPSGLMEEAFTPRMYFTCNPGGVGHQWVKRLFIDRTYKNSERDEDYEFIPSLVYENEWLMTNDPDYVRTLENLPEERRNAMLYGNWDVYDGQFFEEFDRSVHVIEPCKLPTMFKLYRVMDYGLDMLACYHILIDGKGEIKIIHEIYESNLIVSKATAKIKGITKSLGFTEADVFLTLAPEDLWSRDATTGKSAFDIFYENGLTLTKVTRDRVNGWLAVKELLKVFEQRHFQTGDPIKTARLKIFSVCRNLIRCIPLIQYDDKKYNDAATEPHEITHGPDALRYFAIYWISAPNKETAPKEIRMQWTEDMIDDYYSADDAGKERMIELYGAF
jgi:phage terminase large subunit